MYPRELIVFGAGGHGAVVTEAALLSGWRVHAIVDDSPLHDERFGVPVIASGAADWDQLKRMAFIVAIGSNAVRERVSGVLKGRGLRTGVVVHPTAIISDHAFIGGGTIAAAGVVVNPGANISEGCILNTACSVDHDCRIEAHVHIAPRACLAGMVTVGAGSLIGMGAVVLPGIQIGAGCCIGAGSVVNRDIPDGKTAYGCPARIVELTMKS